MQKQNPCNLGHKSLFSWEKGFSHVNIKQLKFRHFSHVKWVKIIVSVYYKMYNILNKVLECYISNLRICIAFVFVNAVMKDDALQAINSMMLGPYLTKIQFIFISCPWVKLFSVEVVSNLRSVPPARFRQTNLWQCRSIIHCLSLFSVQMEFCTAVFNCL